MESFQVLEVLAWKHCPCDLFLRPLGQIPDPGPVAKQLGVRNAPGHPISVSLVPGSNCRGAKLSPQNVSLACRLFPAESNQGPKDLGRNSALPPNYLKNVEKRPVPGRELLP